VSKRSNPTVIGGFVVGAVALLAAGVALFGGSELFTERNHYVAYFEEGTQGLRTGADILMNGVRVGYVSEIALLVDSQSLNTLTRVRIELLPDTYIQTIDGVPVAEGMEVNIGHDWLIDKAGLRAQLGIESFITGQLLIELSFRPETLAELRGIDNEFPEIPTIRSNMQELLDNLENWVSDLQGSIDMSEIGRRIESILEGVDELANSSDVRESLAALNTLLNDEAMQGLSVSVEAALDELGTTLSEANRLFRNTEDDLDALARDLSPAISSLTSTLVEAESMLAAARGQLDGTSPQVYQLESTLRELEGAAIAIREFFDYLERNPEALIRGKQR
jgi:paraquat-inducible protein B